MFVKIHLKQDIKYDNKKDNIDLSDSKYIKINKQKYDTNFLSHTKITYDIFDTKGHILFRKNKRPYSTMQNCKTGIKSVIKNIDAKINND